VHMRAICLTVVAIVVVVRENGECGESRQNGAEIIPGIKLAPQRIHSGTTDGSRCRDKPCKDGWLNNALSARSRIWPGLLATI
jgi:hypothetical protein